MKFFLHSMLLLALLQSTIVNASPRENTSKLNEFFAAKNWRGVLIGGYGTAFGSDLGAKNVIPIRNSITDELYIYTPYVQAGNNADTFHIFLGAERILRSNWLLQLGLGFYQYNNLTVAGSLYQGADAQSADLYTYSYTIDSKQYLIESKLLYTQHLKYHPYIILGMGVSQNNSNHFQTNVNPFLTFTREYSSSSNQRFAAVFGAGLDFDIRSNLRLGFSYRVNALGSAYLGSATIDGTPVPSTLHSENLFVQSLMGELTVFF
jgi:opacity protein-like surface antigen